MRSVFEIKVGERIWLDGQGWDVVELTGTNVRLSAGSSLRVVSITSLAEAAPALIGDEDDEAQSEDRWEVPGVLLASLTARQHQQLLDRLQVLRQISEPDPGDRRTMLERYDEAAAETGVARRTLQRQMARLAASGPAGLVDVRQTRDGRRSVDPRWDTLCRQVLRSYRDRSNPTKQAVIDRTNWLFLEAVPDGKVPSVSVAYLRLAELDKGRYTFGVAKQRRSVANRPTGVLGRLRADRPGQYVLLDSYRMDVFAMEPVTLRWVNTELTVAMDLYDRRITGLRLRPIAAQSPDVASVLFQTVTAQTWGWTAGSPTGPYGGVPENLVLGHPGGVLPDTIVVDHGKIYLSEHTRSVCERLGISIQPAIPDKPTDKPAVERFFRTLRQSLLEHLPGYKGPDVAARGHNVEGAAFYYVTELEQIIREWVGRVYHHTAHAGLVDPLERSVGLSPTEMFERGIAAAGRIRLPARKDLVFDFLEVEWRTIQHYGVEINGQRYDGPGVNDHRGTRSPYGGAHPGKWPFMVDRDDIRTVHFRDPTSHAWHQLEWEHAAQIDAPFSADAATYVRALGAKTGRHVDPQQAVQDLLADWTAGEVATRRDRNLAIRLSAQRATTADGDATDSTDAEAAARATASVPGVVDLFARRRNQGERLTDDLDDVFTRYYAQHPDSDGLEVFDE